MITHTRAISLPETVGAPLEKEMSGWPVITGFDPQVKGKVYLADLCHRPKALVQGPGVDELNLPGVGKTVWTGAGFASMLKPEEAVIYDLTAEMPVTFPWSGTTDMTHAWALFALWGENALPALQRLVTVDLERPRQEQGFFMVTKYHSFGLQLLNPKAEQPGYLVGCTRSHAQNLFDSLCHAGHHLSLVISGTDLCDEWLTSLGR